MKRDYTKGIIWVLLGIITTAMWAAIYNLIF
jgi:hypothetical protein